MQNIKTIILNQLRTPKTFWALMRNNDINGIQLIETLNDFYDKGVIEIKATKIYLTHKGREQLSMTYINRHTRCDFCDSGYLIDGFGDIYYRFKSYYDTKPKNIPEFDQGSMRCEDVLKRLAFIYDKGDLYNTRILILGDDDLLSVAIAMTGLPQEIVVLDIDERLLHYIRDVSSKEHMNIETEVYSIENKVPLQKNTDVFISDPVESLFGIKLFLSRGISLLANGGRFYFGLTHIDSSLLKWQKIEQMLVNGGCVITDVIRDFAFYPDIYCGAVKERLFFDPGPPPKSWYTSSLIRGVKLEDKMSEGESVSLGVSLYKDDETITVK